MSCLLVFTQRFIALASPSAILISNTG